MACRVFSTKTHLHARGFPSYSGYEVILLNSDLCCKLVDVSGFGERLTYEDIFLSNVVRHQK